MTSPKAHRVLVLGATGMFGHALLRYLARQPELAVFGSARSTSSVQLLPEHVRDLVVPNVDVESAGALAALIDRTEPTVIVNCVGLVKQLSGASDPLLALPLNALFPHRLARLAEGAGARVVHISTDCVFLGSKGMYVEGDPCDADDLYGRSKFLGELDYPHTITLRTSMIGHELAGSHGLVEWFLKQESEVRGFGKAIFSGLPTVEFARVIHERVLAHPKLRGVFHVAAEPIDKLSLLRLIAARYGRATPISPDDSFRVDRSLNADRFREATGYVAPGWPELIRRMHEFR